MDVKAQGKDSDISFALAATFNGLKKIPQEFLT